MTITVPDFDLVRSVGRGGFGEVWLAVNRTTGQLRAVKVVPLRQAGETDAAAREIASLTRLQACLGSPHPNLMTIHHVGKTAEYLFYVMDPADDVAGGPASNTAGYRPATLESRLRTAPFSAEVCRDYAGQLLAGLAWLHEAGMVHRDVKPANCLFVAGQLKLADFGLVTESHALVSRAGTQKYMPPDGRMDMRADVYAAGLVIYEMITGLPVDEFPSLGREAQNVRSDPLLAALLRLVLHACEADAERRPADARAMLAELTSPGPTAQRLPRRLLLGTIAAAALCAAGAWAAWMFTVGPSELCEVNFITDPFEAKIYVDGVLQCNPEGNAYTTPCTVPNLRARSCRVEFQWAGQPRWDAGLYDFARTQQIVARRP
jgi:serine/threonine protein kinase